MAMALMTPRRYMKQCLSTTLPPSSLLEKMHEYAKAKPLHIAMRQLPHAKDWGASGKLGGNQDELHQTSGRAGDGKKLR